MPSKLMLVFVGADIIFAACGGLLLGFSLIAEQNLRATPTTANVAQSLLLDQCPLTGTTTSILWPRNAASVQQLYCGGRLLQHTGACQGT